MDVGVSLSLAGLPLRQAMAYASAAERAAMAVVSVGELTHDTFAAATAMGGATSTIALLSGVATWQRPPVSCATGATTADEACGGRYTLGLGTMPAAWSSDFYGIDPSRPIPRMREYVDVVRLAMRAHSGATCDYDGAFFQVRGYRRAAPPVRDDLPVMLAATRPAMASLAGEIGDGVYFNVIHTEAWLRDVLTPALEKGRCRSDREGAFRRVLMVRCAIDDDEDRAIEKLRSSLRTYLFVPYLAEVASWAGFDLTDATARALAGDVDAALTALPTELVRLMGVYGSARQCAKQLRRYDDLVDTIVLAPPSGLPVDVGAQHVESIIATPWQDLL